MLHWTGCLLHIRPILERSFYLNERYFWLGVDWMCIYNIYIEPNSIKSKEIRETTQTRCKRLFLLLSSFTVGTASSQFTIDVTLPLVEYSFGALFWSDSIRLLLYIENHHLIRSPHHSYLHRGSFAITHSVSPQQQMHVKSKSLCLPRSVELNVIWQKKIGIAHSMVWCCGQCTYHHHLQVTLSPKNCFFSTNALTSIKNYWHNIATRHVRHIHPNNLGRIHICNSSCSLSPTTNYY